MKAYLVDDEVNALNILSDIISRTCPEIKEVHTFNSPLNALKQIQEDPPDILFLDIQMPILNGFDLLDKLSIKSCFLIFTTAFDQYAIRAIRYSAFDYLLKPIDDDDLRECMNRVLALNGKEEFIDRKTTLKYNLNQPEEIKNKIYIKCKTKTYVVPVEEIVHLEADKNYTFIHLADGKRIYSSKTLKYYESMLPTEIFLRIHKSQLVNGHFIKSLRSDNILQVTTGINIPVSRRKRHLINEWITSNTRPRQFNP